MDRFAVNMIGIGLSGNENVYIGCVVKFNDFNSALMIVEEDSNFSDLVNEIIVDVKKMWDNANDINAFNHSLNSYTKNRIMPFNLVRVIDAKKMEDVYEQIKKETLKFFKNIELIQKTKTL